MNFKEWLNKTEQLFNEDFKTQREKFIQQGYDANIVDKYITSFKTIKDKNYKQINDPIHGLEHIKDRKNIDAYKTFHELEVLVDYVSGQVDVSGSVDYKNLKFSGKPIFEDNNIQVFYADTPRACIEYKGNYPYSWCIARSDSSNLFYAYKYKEHEPSFYFVKNKEKTNKEFGFFQSVKMVATQSLKFHDKYHFFVLQVVKNANPKNHTQKQYIVTSALNDGDQQMSWNDILKIEPSLTGKEELFQPKSLTDNEKVFYGKYKNGISDEEFVKLPYDQKDMFMNIYIRSDKGLTDKQYASLPEDLKNKYIGFGVGLTDEQYAITSDKLKKRYTQVTLEKIKTLIENKHELNLNPTEIDVLISNVGSFDLNKLSDNNVYDLLTYAKDKDQMANIILKYKKELSNSNIRYLLYHAKDKEQVANILGQENLNKLSDGNVYNLLTYAKDKDQMANILGQENLNKLSSRNIFDLLISVDDKDKLANILGQENLNKLSGNTVRNLLIRAKDKDQMARIILKHKKELSDDNVRYLFRDAKDKGQMANILGQENLNKLSSRNVYHLLSDADDEDEEEMANILGQENLNKLSDKNVYDLLIRARDEEEMANILGQENLNKLSDKNVYDLLIRARDKEQMANILGQENINKLSDESVRHLLINAKDKEQMARILGRNIT